MDSIKLITDLHISGYRQGPGGEETTRLAIKLAGLDERQHLTIADIGCGTGASTITLATTLQGAELTAVDLLPAFLSILKQRAAAEGISNRLKTLAVSMDDLPFAPGSLDVIWSEGAVYNIGFEHGIQSWHKFLKQGGIVALSELTWLSARRPAELEEHWNREYAEVNTASIKITQLEKHGYKLLGYFPLPQKCWLDNYYYPMQQRFETFLKKHDYSPAARRLVEAEVQEIRLYERYSDYFGYGFYIAQKLHD